MESAQPAVSTTEVASTVTSYQQTTSTTLMEDAVVLSEQLLPLFDSENSVVLQVIEGGGGAFYLESTPAYTTEQISSGNHQNSSTVTYKVIPVSQLVSSSTTTELNYQENIGTNNIQQQQRNNVPTSQPLQTANMTNCLTLPASFNTNYSSNNNSSTVPIQFSVVNTVSSNTRTDITSNEDDYVVPCEIQYIENIIDDVEPPHRKGPFRCTICGKEFKKHAQFKKHQSEHLDDKAYKCTTCSMSFNYETNLQVHQIIHQAEETGCLVCKICTAKFSRLASLKSHLRSHQKEENLLCQECGDEFGTKNSLEIHLEEHKPRQIQCMVYRCTMCKKTFQQAALLKDHWKEHAAVRNQLKSLTKYKRKKGKGSKMTPTKSSNSSNDSDEKKNRSCSVCNKHFQKPSQLARHFRIHSGEKPFACLQCPRRFNQKGTLESHVQAMHEKVKPFACDLCSCKFTQRGNLKAHILKVHIPPGENEKAFKCEECTCVYRRRLATLNNHIAKAHAVKSKDTTDDVTESSITTTVQDTLTIASTTATDPTCSKDAKVMSILTASALENDQTEKDINSSTVADKVTEVEVNIAHDEQGRSKRCLVKVKKVGQIKWHLCSYCTKAFKKPSDLIRHLRVHTRERPYLCYVCNKSFAVKSTLTTHLLTHNTIKQLACSVCHKRFHMTAALKAHERMHTGQKPFSCLQCPKTFRTSALRRTHMKTHMRNSMGLSGRRKLLRIGDVQTSEVPTNLPDPLKITDTGLVPVPNRSAQTIIHEPNSYDAKVRPYRCIQCPAGFKKSSHLKAHVRSHTKEKSYKCFQCYRSFVSSGVLKNHIKTHEGLRSFKCRYCNASFTTNGSLTRHLTTHSSNRPYICPYIPCGKGFKSTVACRKHIKTHRNKINNSVTLVPSSPTANSSNTTTAAAEITSDQTDVYTETINNYTHDNEHFEDDYLVADAIFQTQQNATTTTSSVVAHQQQLVEHQIDPNIQQHQHFQDISSIIQSDTAVTGVVYHSSMPLEHQQEQQSAVTSQISSGFETQSMLIQQQQQDIPLLPLLKPSSSITTTNNNTISSTTQQIAPFQYIASESHPVNAIQQQQQQKSIDSATANNNESEEVQKIHESSRPISEQIYNELKAQEAQPTSNVCSSSQDGKNQTVGGYKNECNECHRAFKKKSDLVRHARIHSGEKPFVCNLCGRSFRVKSTREAHMRTHRSGKTVSCHVCNNLFSTKSSLRVHMRLHLNLKPYECPVEGCQRTFRTTGHRKSHVASHFKPTKSSSITTATTTSSITNTTTTTSENMLPQHSVYLTDSSLQQQQQPLPPVETIKDKSYHSLHQQSTSTSVSANTTTTDDGVNNVLTGDTTLIGSLQLTMEGPSIQNIHITGLDLNTFQMDESFLQSLGNVIFMTPQQQQQQSDNKSLEK